MGEKIPKGRLLSATGSRIELTTWAKQEKKTNLLLVFFRTGTCSVCTSQLVEFAQNLPKIQELNATVLAVSADDALVQVRTSEKIDYKFPLLMDPDAKTIKRFGVFNPDEKLARPSLFLVARNREILYSYVGKDLRDRPTLDQVLEVLKKFSTGKPKRAVANQPEGK